MQNPTGSSAQATARLETVTAHLTASTRRGRRTRLSDLPLPSQKPRLIPTSRSDGPISGSHQPSKWSAPPTSILIVHKRGDARLDNAVGRVISYIAETYGQLRILVEQYTANKHPGHDLVVIEAGEPLLFEHTDFVLALGGDGTMLHVSYLFAHGECPPVLCFSMGTVGFLLPFNIDSFVDVLRSTLEGSVSILYRMRLECTPLDCDGLPLARCGEKDVDRTWQVLNEVALNRGRYSHLAALDVYLNDDYLTKGIADGLLMCTPTGSTAYNLSSGGPISHPEIDAMILTPIAPRSLSFRSVVLPGTAKVRLEVTKRARAPVTLALDGREVDELDVGESILVRRSQWPMPCIERGGGPGKGWVKDINSLLLFNTGFVNKQTAKDIAK